MNIIINMKSVDIFGTCYTRELFNTTTCYEVNTYLMQQSIFTMFSNPFVIEKENAISHDNYDFKNRMIYYEFNKLGMPKLLDNPAEYLIIDLADQARDILEFSVPRGAKLIFTHDIQFSLSHIMEQENYSGLSMKKIDVRNYSDQEIKQYLSMFINKLLEKYEEEKIILNRVQMQNIYYIDNQKNYIKDNFIYNRRKFIKKIEDMFLVLLPNCKSLYSKYTPVLDINHRFGGPHPVHFESIYYQYRMNLLNELINGSNSFDEINKEYQNIYYEEIPKIKGKKLIK